MATIDSVTIYNSVRQEILDQKRCQFQMFAASVTFSSAGFAYSGTQTRFIVLLAPIIPNVLALFIILDKAKSMQRMVGYLQLLESSKAKIDWMWEYHLNEFREIKSRAGRSEPYRKHKYIRNIAIILIALNSLLGTLYFWSLSKDQNQSIGFSIHIIVVAVNMIGIAIAIHRYFEFVRGGYTTNAIRSRWVEAIEKSEKSDKEIKINA